MDIDKDIQDILQEVALGRHPLTEAIERFLQSLPGYDYRFHSRLTIKTYERSLLRDPLNFRSFMQTEGIDRIELVTRDKLFLYVLSAR
jgi:hypothetical protein